MFDDVPDTRHHVTLRSGEELRAFGADEVDPPRERRHDAMGFRLGAGNTVSGSVTGRLGLCIVLVENMASSSLAPTGVVTLEYVYSKA